MSKNNNLPTLLVDLDYTIVNTDTLKQDYSWDQVQDAELVNNTDFNKYLYPDSLEFLKSASKFFNLVAFTEGPLHLQKAKITQSKLKDFFKPENSLVYEPHQKAQQLQQIQKEHPNLYLIDDKADILDQAINLGIFSIRISRGKHKDTHSETQPHLNYKSLAQINPDILSKISNPITNSQNIHLTGIKGVGMTALALILKDLGKNITGSDTDNSQITDTALVKAGIKTKSFDPKNISSKTDLIVYSGAYRRSKNLELVQSTSQNIPTITQAQALSHVSNQKQTIAVCGVGGKTTTTSMLLFAAHSLKLKPSWFVGTSQVGNLPPGRYDSNDLFIVEADEYAIDPPLDNRAKFQLLSPKVIVCTNLLHDHPDIYKNYQQTLETFIEFFNNIPSDGLFLINSATKNLDQIKQKLTTKAKIQTFGTDPTSDWFFDPNNSQVKNNNQAYPLALSIPGDINALNAVASMAALSHFAANPTQTSQALSQFPGCKRRFELIKTQGDIHYYDDYAHHPHEVKSAIAAFRQKFTSGRLIIVFHPHTYSRTQVLLEEFSQAFGQADQVIIAPIFASAREKAGDINSAKLTKSIQTHNQNTQYLPSKSKIIDHLKNTRQSGDVIVTMGAGDIYQIHDQLWIKL